MNRVKFVTDIMGASYEIKSKKFMKDRDSLVA